jgi:ATP-dependent Lhr-like helicase
MSGEVWTQVYDRLAQLVRSIAPRWCSSTRADGGARRAPSVRALGEENVAAHHGSLSKERRLDAEQR